MQRKSERFSRQEAIPAWNQQKLDTCTVLVVGCGGIGTWTAVSLSMLGSKNIFLVDPDTIEESNLNRQLYWEAEIGQSKARALAKKLQGINAGCKVTSIVERVERVNPVILRAVDVIFDCLDNIPTREWLGEYAAKHKKVLVHAGCSAKTAEVQLVVPGKTKPLRPYPQSMKQNATARSCKEFDPSVVTINMMVASLQVEVFLQWLMEQRVDRTTILYLRGKGLSYA